MKTFLILMFPAISHAITCSPILAPNELVLAMANEQARLEEKTRELSPKELVTELNALNGTTLVDVLGVSMIPYSIEALAKRHPFTSDRFTPFVDAWNEQIWTYVLISEFRRRLKK